ncbi:MAG: 3-oxoacid CoA-transferase [Eubacterium sp.]|nr:3-oxoacid CoA-transferase [Eubacterium sp.]
MKVITANQVASLIQDNAYLGVGGFGAFGAPEELLIAIAEAYKWKGTPSNLTIISGISCGDMTKDGRGLNHLRAPGLIRTMIAAHVGVPASIGNAIGENKIAGFMLPMGVYDNLLRAKAANRPGFLTKVGLNTFCDPRIDGCKVNCLAKKCDAEIVRLMEIDGEEYLFYKTFPIDACIIRGTYADEDGNISLKEEALIAEQLEMAMATRNTGGKVFVQVKEIVSSGTLPAKEVHIHHKFVDYVIVAKPENHPQGFDNPELRWELTGEKRVPLESIPEMELSVRKVIARRAAQDLENGALVNLGIGMPDGVAMIANEEGINVTLSIESGTLGGVPVGGLGLGASVNPDAIYHIADNFDMYDGGGLDMAFLGAAQIDKHGNVNVSKFGSKCTGPGGFIDITQSTKKVYFMGTFTAGKAEYEIKDGEIHIVKDGTGIKFVDQVEQITFSAKYARNNDQQVCYITERAVFELTEEGFLLTEIAPGVDLQKDILDKMEFAPVISSNLKTMDAQIFS